MTVTAKPIVLNDDGTKHVALPDGFYIDNASIDKDSLISKDKDNLLKTGSDGKLLVANKPIEDTAIVSNDAGNLLTKGSDKGAYLAASALPTQVSAGSGTSVDAGKVSVNVGKGLGVNSANQLYVDTNELTTVLATKEEVKALQRQVDIIDTENMNFTISRTTVNPVTLDKGEAALYPSEDLLG